MTGRHLSPEEQSMMLSEVGAVHLVGDIYEGVKAGMAAPEVEKVTNKAGTEAILPWEVLEHLAALIS